jgi:hypothetical protein
MAFRDSILSDVNAMAGGAIPGEIATLKPLALFRPAVTPGLPTAVLAAIAPNPPAKIDSNPEATALIVSDVSPRGVICITARQRKCV